MGGVLLVVEVVVGFLGWVFVFEVGVDVVDEVVIIVVVDNEFFDFVVFVYFVLDVFVEGVEVVLELGGVYFVFWVEGWVLVEVGYEDCLWVGGFDVFVGVVVVVVVGVDFVVEGVVDFVLFGVEDGGEEVGYFGGLVIFFVVIVVL